MKNIITILLIKTPLLLGLIATTGCASKTPRTKWTDPVMRVAIDPFSISAGTYVGIQQALVQTGKWIVVDRASAFEAVKREQERQHLTDSDRFADREKYAIWGRLLGVGGIVTAHKQCSRAWGWFGGRKQNCSLHLAIVSANTAQVLAAVSLKQEAEEWDTEPEWNDIAYALTKAFPNHFEKNKNHPRLETYKDIAKEEAIRQKEKQDAK